MTTENDSTPSAHTEAPDKGVGCGALLAELDTMRRRLFDLANANAGNDKGNAACLLHAASNEINRAMRCLERGNPKDEGIPPHLLAQTLGFFR